ncbi:hypothetical protein AB0L25_39095 [Spirillospora sp. NPDC052242]
MVTAGGADVAVGPDGTVIVATAGDDLESLEHLDGDRATALRMFIEGWRPKPADAPELFDIPWTRLDG